MTESTIPDTTGSVDTVPTSHGGTGDTGRQPIVADWMRRGELGTTVRKTSRRWRHTLARHLAWLPVYVARLLKWCPRGLGRSVAWLWRALLDEETKGLQRHHAHQRDTAEYVRLEQLRRDRVRSRQIAFWVILTVIGIGIALIWYLVSPLLFWAVSAAVLLVLGWIGRPRDTRLLNAVPLVDGAPSPVSAPMVREALCSLGIPRMTDPESIGVLMDVARTAGGYQVGLELPKGVEANDVIEKRSKLAAALRRDLGTVWPGQGSRHVAHLDLYIADEPVSSAKQRHWTLTEKGQTNIFDPIPMFTDQRGQWVDQRLAYMCGVVGGIPGSGKTFYMRQIGLVFALDPRAQIYAYDLKSTGDFGPLSVVAHGYGLNDEEKDITKQLEELTALHDDMRRRVKVIRKLAETDRALCPENKVTDQLASMPELKLHPVLLLVDECQEWFEHSNNDMKKEFIRLCTDFVKRGRAAGIHAFFGTQKPDMKSLPSPISANAGIRFCLRVTTHHANDAVLGTGAHSSGFNATVLTDKDRGMGYLRGESSEPQIVRTVKGLDGLTAEAIALRARAVRQAQGRLSGYAAGEDITNTLQQVNFLADCRQVLGSSDAIHLVDLAEGLAALRHRAYSSLNSTSVGQMLRELDIEPRVVYDASKGRERGNGQGVRRQQLQVSATDPDGDEDTREREPEGMIAAK